ncbi:MAG: hypothetical protein ABIH04_00215 [Planctomycetota bacterium]
MNLAGTQRDNKGKSARARDGRAVNPLGIAVIVAVAIPAVYAGLLLCGVDVMGALASMLRAPGERSSGPPGAAGHPVPPPPQSELVETIPGRQDGRTYAHYVSKVPADELAEEITASMKGNGWRHDSVNSELMSGSAAARMLVFQKGRTHCEIMVSPRPSSGGSDVDIISLQAEWPR